MAQRIGIDGIFAINDRLGLGQKYDLPVSGMAHGNNPSRDWKLRQHGEDWLIGDTINASIGQGFTLASPIQLATRVSRLASGIAVVPRLVRPVGDLAQADPPAPSLGLSSEALALVRQGMFEVSNHEKGTAYASRIADPAKLMAVYGRPVAGRSAVGPAGSCTVRRLCAVRRTALCRDGRGGTWWGWLDGAAPIARDIMLFAQHGGLPPEDAYPTSQRSRVRYELLSLSERLLPPDAGPGKPTKT